MKTLVLTICIPSESLGNLYNKIIQLTHATIKAYADKIGSDFKVITEQKGKYPHYEKFQIYQLFDQYDRIIYVDSDVLIKSNCPNLVELFNDDEIGMFNEGSFLPWDEVLKEASIRYNMEYKEYKDMYYNTGVMVIPKKCKDVFLPPEFEQNVFAGCAAYDQPYINLKLRELNVKIKELDYQFNRMEYIDKLT
jgi:lipopolysaccharide biosynthesis glycosyltransferase